MPPEVRPAIYQAQTMRKRLIDHISHLFLSILFVFTSVAASAQAIDGDAAHGKSLFNANCASCHKLDRKLIGPALGGVTNRRDQDWLHNWIKNNQELRESGDATANALFKEYNGTAMPTFPGLSEQDINDILAYTASDAGQADKVVNNGSNPIVTPAEKDNDNTIVLLVIGGVLLLLIVLLAKVKNTLKQVKGEPSSTILEDANIITRTALKNPRIVTILTIIIAVVFFQQLFVALMATGVHEGYQPKQPIAFSHKLHAGDNQINCRYCHYAARKSKHSNIPAPMVCMNCHKYIQNGPTTGTTEISKIYAAVGFDPAKGEYIEGYKQKPIKWIRIHNLPDLAYYNHSQHVTVAKIECQTCHGPVQEMEEVYQYSPLTMGWCINCHRQTEVQVNTNEYYSDIHENLKRKFGPDAKVTVEMVGGLECGKCHY